MSTVIAILSKAEGQKIARPFNRASSIEETAELLKPYVNDIDLSNINTDTPVGHGIRYGQKVKYYAFVE